ncbi:serine/threonine protein kinase [Streptomyces sp. NPDC002920]
MSHQGRLIAGRYRVLDRIGRGGMAVVWRAHDDLLDRQVAVKRLHPQPHLDDDELATLFERARREARSTARIVHPNVVVVHDVVDDEGLPTIVMEYVPSTNLNDLVEEHGPVPPEEAARIGLAVLAALRAAHRAGILHRDVKPANVLLAEDGRVVLTDFGIAHASETSQLTRTGQLVGSVDFIAPERLVGAAPGPESDLWALGATLFQAVDGRSPFLRGSVTETMYAIAMEPVPEVRSAGPLAPLIRGLLASKPADRLSAEDAERLLRTATASAADRGSGSGGGSSVAPAQAARRKAKLKPKPGPDSGLLAGETSAVGLPGEHTHRAAARVRAQRRPSARSRKRAVLVAAVATAVLIAIALLVTTAMEKDPASAAPSGDPVPVGDTTAPRTPGTGTASPVSSPSASPGSDAVSPTAQPSLPSTTGTGQEDAEVPAGGGNVSTGPDVAPTGRALVVEASGKCLSGGEGNEGTQLFQATCDGSAAQRWQIRSDGTIRSSGKCMTAAGGETAERTEIQLAGCDGGASQEFRLVGTELRADQSQRCVDIFGGASGTGAVLFECNGRDNQTWTAQ